MNDSDEDDYLAISDWPDFEIKWDLDPNNFYWCLGSKENYLKDFPNGAKLGEASLNEIIENLNYISNAPMNKTDTDYSSVLNYWSKGGLMTPPLLDVGDSNKIHIGGGNHRFGVCRGKQIERIKFLAHPDNKAKLDGILSSLKWL